MSTDVIFTDANFQIQLENVINRRKYDVEMRPYKHVKKCVALVGDVDTCKSVIGQAMAEGLYMYDDLEEKKEFCLSIWRYDIDKLGKNEVIFYWPEMEFIEATEEEKFEY